MFPLRWFRKSPRPAAKRPRSFRPSLDVLEDRRVPAAIFVNDTGDAIANDTVVTLREAIQAVNAGHDVSDVHAIGTYGQSDEIDFKLPGSSVHTIFPIAPLPALAKSVFLNG